IDLVELIERQHEYLFSKWALPLMLIATVVVVTILATRAFVFKDRAALLTLYLAAFCTIPIYVTIWLLRQHASDHPWVFVRSIIPFSLVPFVFVPVALWTVIRRRTATWTRAARRLASYAVAVALLCLLAGSKVVAELREGGIYLIGRVDVQALAKWEKVRYFNLGYRTVMFSPTLSVGVMGLVLAIL